MGKAIPLESGKWGDELQYVEINPPLEVGSSLEVVPPLEVGPHLEVAAGARFIQAKWGQREVEMVPGQELEETGS